jgi:hypothetical protein
MVMNRRVCSVAAAAVAAACGRGRGGVLVCMQAEAEAMQRAVAHGDVGISTPAADGGESFIAVTPNGRAPYQPLQMVGRSKL